MTEQKKDIFNEAPMNNKGISADDNDCNSIIQLILNTRAIYDKLFRLFSMYELSNLIDDSL